MSQEEYERLKKDVDVLKEKWRLQEHREVLLSRQLLVYSCIIAEVGLVLATAAALWSAKVAVDSLQHPGAWPATISTMVSPWGEAEGRIFFGLIIATGITLLSSKYADLLLKVESVWEQTLLDVMVPVGIIVLACVPTSITDHGGFKIQSTVHSVAAGVVFVVAPVVLLIKCIPRHSHEGFVNRHGFFRANYFLSRSRDVLLRLSPTLVLRYSWWMMAVLQVITFVFFSIFQYFNSNYATHESARFAKYHVLSFVSEFLCISGLFVSFLLIALIGKKTGDGGGSGDEPRGAEKEEASGGEGKQAGEDLDV